jgi:hypothetical protein
MAGASNIMKATDLEGILGWMDNYCRSNPLRPVAAGAEGLVVNLLAIRNSQ